MKGHGTVRARIEELLMACIGAVSVDGGSMSLVSATGPCEPLFGSDSTAETLEQLQFTLGEGPCVDASSTGTLVLVPDLEDPRSGVRDRWPAFLPEAAKADVRAVFAFPVRIGAISLGTMDLYRRSPGPLRRDDLTKALTTVDAVALSLLDVDGVHDGGHNGGHNGGHDGGHDGGLVGVRLSSMVVHQAAGMVMVQLGVTIEDALTRLRAAAYSDGVAIHELATDVVSGHRRFQEERS